MSKPLLSIYVPTYNHQDFIAECLEGIIMQQTDFPFEAIVIDDCSTDDTPKIIADYAARYPDIIKPVYNDHNWFSERKSKIYPIFVAKAQGEFFAVCDGDDYWTDPHKLQIQIDFLRSHPKYSGCGHLCGYSDYEEGCSKKDYDVDIYDLAVRYHIQSSTIVGKFEVFTNDKEQYHLVEDEQIPFSDTILMAGLLNMGPIRMMLKRMSTYREHPESMTNISRNNASWDEINRTKHAAIVKMYGGRFSDLYRRMRVNELMAKSAKHASDKKYLLSLQYKLRAFATMPGYVIKLYRRRYL